MKKKTILLLALFVLPIITIFLGGYAYFKSTFTLEVEHEGNIILKKQYQIPFRTVLGVALRHNGNYGKLYQAQSNMTYAQRLDFLSKGLSSDVLVAQKYNSKPQEACYHWDERSTEFTYTKEVWGQEVDMDALAKSIFENLDTQVKVSLPCKSLPPEKSYLDIKKATALRGFFTTNYTSSASGRKHNIKLAADRLNGAVIPSNSKFSFNAVVGERTVANGFMQSIIISGGKFTPGVGGGVCQVSTTLYNACLRAGLSIDYAKPHSLRVSYVPPSFDAMVSNTNDLVIKNNTNSAFFLKTHADGNDLSIYVYGDDATGGAICNIKSVIERHIECAEYEEIKDTAGTLAPGEKKVLKSPKAGLVSSAYMEYYQNGVLVSRKRIRQDYYSPQKGIIMVSPPLEAFKLHIANVSPKESYSYNLGDVA